MSRKLLKENARDLMSGRLVILILGTLIAKILPEAVLWYIPSFSDIAYIAWLALTAPLSYGLICLCLALLDDSPYPFGIQTVFKGFGNYKNVLFLEIRLNIFTTLWTLLLVVPGIVKTISWSQSRYVLAEHPELTAKECMGRSADMMEGHKMEYFILLLSFIPWLLLCVITAGLALLWVMPYMQTTCMLFYKKVNSSQIYDRSDLMAS